MPRSHTKDFAEYTFVSSFEVSMNVTAAPSPARIARWTGAKRD